MFGSLHQVISNLQSLREHHLAISAMYLRDGRDFSAGDHQDKATRHDNLMREFAGYTLS